MSIYTEQEFEQFSYEKSLYRQIDELDKLLQSGQIEFEKYQEDVEYLRNEIDNLNS